MSIEFVVHADYNKFPQMVQCHAYGGKPVESAHKFWALSQSAQRRILEDK